MRKKLMAMLLCPAVLLTGCSLFEKEEGDGSGYRFNYTLTENPDSLDPQIARNSAAFTVLRNMMQGLLEEQPDGTLTYGVCSHYSVTEDGKRYTFTLRDDSYWYYDENKNDRIDDGESWLVTAEDFVFAFQRLFRNETKSPYREQFRCIKGGADVIDGGASAESIGVYAQSSNTLIFELDEPCAEFLTLLCMPAAMPCSRVFFEQTGGRYGLDEDSVISNSGFYLRRWFYDPYGSDNLIYMRENSANNTVQKVYPSNVTFLIRSSQEDAESEFAAGNSDILATSHIEDKYTEANGYTIDSWRSITLGFVLNDEWEAFTNIDIRKAFSAAVPRSQFSDSGKSDAVGAYGIVPPETRLGAASYESYASGNIIADSTAEEAMELFQKGMHELGLTSLPAADVLVCDGSVSDDDLYEILQTWQSLFGFYAGIEKVSAGEFRQRLLNKDYTIALCGITGDRNSAAAVLQNFVTDNNDFGYSDEAFDQLLRAADDARDLQELSGLCRQAEQAVIDKYIFLPVLYKNQYLIYSSGNRDISYDPYSGVIDFRRAKYYS